MQGFFMRTTESDQTARMLIWVLVWRMYLKVHFLLLGSNKDTSIPSFSSYYRKYYLCLRRCGVKAPLAWPVLGNMPMYLHMVSLIATTRTFISTYVDAARMRIANTVHDRNTTVHDRNTTCKWNETRRGRKRISVESVLLRVFGSL